MDCVSVRLGNDERTYTSDVEAHVAGCDACAVERRVERALSVAVVIEAPADLSVRLLALASPQPIMRPRLESALAQGLVVQAPVDLSKQLLALAAPQPVVAQAQRRWVIPVYALTAVLLCVVLVVAGQLYWMALQQLGVTELWAELMALPEQWLKQFYAFFPQGQYLVSLFQALQRALQWVLVGLVMWAVLEMRMPQRVSRRLAS